MKQLPRMIGPGLLMLLAASVLLDGCGYRTFGAASFGEVNTIFVPIFENYSFRRGYEFQLTEAVIEQIQREGTFRVASRDEADSELQVAIMEYTEPVLLEDAKDQVLEAEAMVSIQLVWRDLRNGSLLLKEDSLRVAAPFIVPLGGDEPTARNEAFKRMAEIIVDSILIAAQARGEG
jgi:hypothetical protein